MGGDIDKTNKAEKVFSRNRLRKYNRNMKFKIQQLITHIVQVLHYLKQSIKCRLFQNVHFHFVHDPQFNSLKVYMFERD